MSQVVTRFIVDRVFPTRNAAYVEWGANPSDRIRTLTGGVEISQPRLQPHS